MLILSLIASKLYNEEFDNYNYYAINNDVDENKIVKYDIISALYLGMLGYNSNYYYRWRLIDNIFIIILYIITFLISIFAAYLSFTCNWKGTVNNILIKLIFAFCAFMLGPFYLVWFILVNYLGKLC
jgi:hypothetical protein